MISTELVKMLIRRELLSSEELKTVSDRDGRAVFSGGTKNSRSLPTATDRFCVKGLTVDVVEVTGRFGSWFGLCSFEVELFCGG